MYPSYDNGENGGPTGEPVPINLDAGDEIFLESRAWIGGSDNGKYVKQYKDSELDGSDESYFKLTIDCNPSADFTTQSKDIKVSHDVSILGFHLNNIRIPKSMAKDIQGFRVYRAKRGHENKTILG